MFSTLYINQITSFHTVLYTPFKLSLRHKKTAFITLIVMIQSTVKKLFLFHNTKPKIPINFSAWYETSIDPVYVQAKKPTWSIKENRIYVHNDKIFIYFKSRSYWKANKSPTRFNLYIEKNIEQIGNSPIAYTVAKVHFGELHLQRSYGLVGDRYHE